MRRNRNKELALKLMFLHDSIGDFRIKAKEIRRSYQTKKVSSVIREIESDIQGKLYLHYKTPTKLGGTMSEVIVTSDPSFFNKTRNKVLQLQLVDINGNEIKDPDSHWIVDDKKLKSIKKRLLQCIDKTGDKKFNIRDNLKDGVKFKMIHGSLYINNVIKRWKFIEEFYEEMENNQIIVLNKWNHDLVVYIDKSLIQKENG